MMLWVEVCLQSARAGKKGPRLEGWGGTMETGERDQEPAGEMGRWQEAEPCVS